MTIVLSIYALAIYAKILITKFNQRTMMISCGVMLASLALTYTLGKKNSIYTLIFFLSSSNLILAFNQIWIIPFKRKLYRLPALVLLLPLLLIPLFKTQFPWKVNFFVFGFSFLLGLALDLFFSSPYPFVSYFEYRFYKSSKNNLQNSVTSLQSHLKNNLGNFVLGQAFVKSYVQALPSAKSHFPRDLLVNLLIFWVSKKSISSLHPLAKEFNQLSLDDIKDNFTFYDLNNGDLPWIHDVFRTGCWKVGLYVLDQYLLTNKQSQMYASSLLWSDRILTDLKKVSFDDETIETWLMDYRERFKGTPLSTKIQLVYHNKDDWFEGASRFAAI